MALAATIALAVSLPATASVVVADASSDPLKAAEAYQAYLAQYAPGMVQPIFDYSTIAALRGKMRPQCQAASPRDPDRSDRRRPTVQQA